MKIAFLGVGQMGRPMIERLLAHGHELCIYNRTRAKAEFFSRRARICDSAKEAVDSSDFVITMLYDSAAVNQVLRGGNSVFSPASKGKVLIDMTSGDPISVIELSDHLRAFGVELVDAPVMGMPSAAIRGELKILASGNDETIDRCLPIFEAFATKVYRLGKVGNGKFTKMVNMMMFGVNLVAMSEAIGYCDRAGIDLARFTEVVNEGSGSSFASRNGLPKVISNDFTVGGSTALIAKDMKLTFTVGQILGTDMPILEKAISIYDEALSEGLGKYNEVGIALHYRKRAENSVVESTNAGRR